MSMTSAARRAIGRWRKRLRPPQSYASPIEYWHARAQELGPGAVFNRGHPPERLDAVTAYQKDVLYPPFRDALNGWERVVLDFGCGTGRFTADLAEMVGGRALGVDPIASLLQLAPPHPAVEYRLMEPTKLPVDTGSVDVAWVCLVLGGIVDDATVRSVTTELERALRRDGLLFVVENVSDQPDGAMWVFRSVAEYASLFSEVPLRQVGEYEDLGERIAILAGRRR